MADYQEGHILTNKSTGDQVRLEGGEWKPYVSTMQDIKSTTIPSLVRGGVGLATTPAAMVDLAEKGIDWAAEKMLSEERAAKIKEGRDVVNEYVRTGLSALGPHGQAVLGALGGPQNAEVIKLIEDKTGPLYKAKTPLGKFWQTGLEFAPAVLAGPGAWPAKIAQGAGSALLSEAGGQATEGTWLEPWSRFGGAVLGAKIPAAVRGVRTPFPTSPERTEAADLLKSRGVDVTAGQSTGSGWLGSFENDLSKSVAAPARFKDLEGRQAGQITREMMKETGSNIPTSKGLAQRGEELGKVVEDLSKRNDLMFDPKLATDLRGIKREYDITRGITGGGGKKSQIDLVIQRVGFAGSKPPPINPATGQPTWSPMGMTGVQYQELRSDLSRQAQRLANANADPDRAHALRGIRDRLDDAMERTLQRAQSPDLGRWQQFRKEWSNYNALSDAAGVAGPQARLGILNPRDVYQSAKDKPLSKGLAELSGAGEAVLQPLPVRSPAQDLAATVGALGGGGVGRYLGGGAATGLEGALVGMFGVPHMVRALMNNPITARAVLSGPGQKYLANQRWLPGSATTTDPAIVARLLAAKASKDNLLEAE